MGVIRRETAVPRLEGMHYGYVILFFSMLNIAGSLGIGRFAYTMILPAMREGLGLHNTQMGLIGTIGFIGYLAMAIPGGVLAARFGPRVAAMIFGPEKVILAVGMNKVAPDLETAMARVRHYAAPVNAIRLGLKTPCVEKGLCTDCRSPQRICNMWSIIEGHMIEGRIHVKLIGENLGY